MEPSAATLAWVEATWPDRSWAGAEVRHGAFHEVVVASDHVARVARGDGHRSRVDREAGLLQLAGQLELSCAVPVLLGGTVSRDGRSGFRTTALPGEQRDSASWREVRKGLLAILAELAQVSPKPGTALPAARMWCGGPDWPAIVAGRLLCHLPRDLAGRASAVVADVVAVEQDSAPGFVHGDFGLHNVLWVSCAPCGLIDFDHLGWGDPAIDVAPLVGMFSAARLSGDFDQEVLRRAMVHRASLPLQVAAAAELAGDAGLRDHALGNFTARAASGTLHDPGGHTPTPEGKGKMGTW